MSNRRGRGGGKGGSSRRGENNRIYANPLPLIIEPISTDSFAKRLGTSFLGIFGFSAARISTPHLEGIFDAISRSVWLPVTEETLVLWRRGFFGKGNLSRSEPSWLARQINQQKVRAAGGVTAEEVREKRRAERKQFKLDRARAIAEASMEAEKAFASSGVVLKESSVMIPSSSTWKPVQHEGSSASPSRTLIGPRGSRSADSDPLEETRGGVESVIMDEEPADFEHLQLTLQEAFFLVWTMDCLSILDASTGDPIRLHRIWHLFQAVHYPIFHLSPTLDVDLWRFDNPFIIHYVAFHHYRSLGWVIRGGIKFCVDYLLYKRGPVFAHAEFAIVVCPVYEDPADRDTSPFNLQNVEPFTWSWLSTINRVNSQVQKTLILTYVTIPAMSRLPKSALESPACLANYTVREVIVRRFIPARMRD